MWTNIIGKFSFILFVIFSLDTRSKVSFLRALPDYILTLERGPLESHYVSGLRSSMASG